MGQDPFDPFSVNPFQWVAYRIIPLSLMLDCMQKTHHPM